LADVDAPLVRENWMPSSYMCRGLARLAATASVVFVAMLWGPRAVAACPTESSDIELSGSVGPASTVTLPITVEPCETLEGEAILTNGPNEVYGAAHTVTILSGTTIELFKTGAPCYGSCTYSIPGSTSSGVVLTPIKATLGASGRPAAVSIRAQSNNAPVAFVVRLRKTPRPGYNVGSATITGAPLLAGPVATVKATLHDGEPGQYFRLRLREAATIRVTGTGQAWPYPNAGDASTGLYVNLYNGSGQFVKELARQVIAKTPTAIAPPIYTVPSGVPGEYYLHVFDTGATRPLWELELVIEFQEGPKLTLFLDADPTNPDSDFDPIAPISDHPGYLPGADPGSGQSVQLPQTLRAIAAFVDAGGAIVAPPYGVTSVAFSLEDTSAFKGTAMNSGADTGIDYSLGGSVAIFAGDNTASVTLWCYDYGGFTRLSTTDGVATADFRLPLDIDNNWMPDVLSDSGQPGDDDDALPALDGTPGDGLSRFEEFRGFVVRGVHQRTSPSFKDVFIYSQFLGVGIGYAVDLPMTIHEIDDLDMDARRQIAPNYTNTGQGGDIPGHLDLPLPPHSQHPSPAYRSGQKAIAVYEDITMNTLPAGQSSFGRADAWLDSQQQEIYGPPWFMPTSGSFAYPIRIRLASPPTVTPTANAATTADPPDDDKLRQTIAHEIGHNLTLRDVSYVPPSTPPPPNQCPPRPTTVMIVSYFSAPAQSSNDCSWNNVPMEYDTTNVSGMRLR
jgi:hypothetical protein